MLADLGEVLPEGQQRTAALRTAVHNSLLQQALLHCAVELVTFAMAPDLLFPDMAMQLDRLAPRHSRLPLKLQYSKSC